MNEMSGISWVFIIFGAAIYIWFILFFRWLKFTLKIGDNLYKDNKDDK